MKEIKVIQSNQYNNNYKTLKRVAAYARVSTKLEMQSSSLALQIRHYAKEIIFNPEYIFAGIYADHGKSGTSMKSRDGLQDLLKKIYAGHIDLVLVKSLSRFARNTIDALTIIKETRKLGVEFYFEKEGISSLDPAIDMLFTMMASMAEQESDSMSQNISWSFQKQAQKGKVSLHKCIGYTLTKDKKFIINENEALIIRKIFQMKLDGSSNSDIFDYVSTTGLKTINGYNFTQNSQILGILKDIKYTGQVVWGKTYRGKLNNEKVTFKNDGEKPKYIIKNHHEPIIDINVFNQVQELLGGTKINHPHEKNTKNEMNRFVYSLMHEKYLYVKSKHKDNPKYDLLENDNARKPGSPRIYSRNATHVLRKATIALARNFSELESKFDKHVNSLLNVKPMNKKLSVLGEEIRKYKNEYFTLIKNDHLEKAELALLGELEESIIKLSMDYVRLEDETLPIKDQMNHIKRIKKSIESIELPMVDLPINAIKEIFDVMVVVNPENYIAVINASGKKFDADTLKKVTEMKPLLESICIARTKKIKNIKWKIVFI
ncbi:MAG: recombinase family protein [Acholeplasmataceae bacterium]|nr:recombinase family protein [Acholeplasmataceae bacterium]